jgi:putative glycosyltransferase (TIGR04372 family)
VFSTQLLKIRIILQTNIQKLLLTILNYSFTGHFSFFSTAKVDLVKRSEFFPKSPFDIFKIASDWSKSYGLWNEGRLEQATKLRVSLLEKIYEMHKVDDHHFPPAISNQFFGAFGHHAFTGIYIAAQKVGLIPQSKRIALTSPSIRNDLSLSMYQDNLIFTNYAFSKGFTEFPTNWHTFERIEIIRGKGSFIDSYDLVDKVFRLKPISLENPFFEVSALVIDQSQDKLKEFGLSQSDWFVGLHIRDGGKTPALRNQQVSNYLPAIKEITDKGGWVIRIGGTEMPPLPIMPRVIDLTTQPNALREVHLFVLAKCKFFIGTCSGPQFFPSLFGVPTLFTNQIGPGRSILTFSQHSIHLPKHCVMGDGREVGLYEMFNSPFGFGELTLKEFADRDIHIQENTSEEIRQAVVEIFSRIDGTYLDDDTDLDKRVAEIRSEFWWTSKGRIASSYLRENESWFLN